MSFNGVIPQWGGAVVLVGALASRSLRVLAAGVESATPLALASFRPG